ncbi:MAG: COR domain-containing protein [Lewinella sp.]
MSATTAQHPQAIRQLAQQLGLDPDVFIDESHVGRRGFFRYGRKIADACRYCLDGDRVVGLSLRGQHVSDLKWLEDAAFCDVEDLLIGDNMFTSLTIPAGWTKLRRVDLSYSPRLRRVVFAGATDQLERLEITDSGLTQLKLPASGCPKLQFLDLSRSEIKKLALSGPCSSLHSLHLRAAAHLETLEINTPLPALDTLELIDCVKLKGLPGEVLQHSPLERLYLSGCMPRNCPSYLCTNDSLEGVSVWFRELAKGSGVSKRVKLLISGNGDVGKSTIQCALANTDALACTCTDEHETTHGILIGDFEHNDITFSYWDFGGQDIYGATHRLFFADEAVQLLVFDPRYEQMARNGEEGNDRTVGGLEQKHQLPYFHAIQRDKSKHDTFVIVQNKYDKIDPGGVVDYASADENLLQYARQQLNGRFLHVDAISGYNIDELLDVIVALGKELPRYNMHFPQTWLEVRQWFIDNDGAGEDKEQRITARYFEEKICVPNGVVEADARKYLLDFLQSAGYCYVINNTRHAGEGEEGADIIVDQGWALQAIYRPLDRKNIRKSWIRMNGQVTAEDIFAAFDTNDETYSEKDKWLFLNFMQENRLCFSVTSEQEEGVVVNERNPEDLYVFPQYLPQREPANFTGWALDQPEVLHFQIRPDFVNKAALHAFICRLGRKTELRNLWRYGILIVDEDNKNLFAVRMNLREACYEVFCERKATEIWLKSLLEEAPAGELFIRKEGVFVPYEKDGKLPLRAVAEGKDVLTDLADKIPQQRHVSCRALIVVSHPQGTDEIPVGNELGLILTRANSGKADTIFKTRGSLSEDILMEATAEETPDVLHFIGHGATDGLLFHRRNSPQPDKKTTGDLRRMFRDITSRVEDRLRVVLLNACYTERTAMAISTNDLYVIGTVNELKSNHGTEFAGAFYRFYQLYPNDITKTFREALSAAVREGASKEDYHLFYAGEKIS